MEKKTWKLLYWDCIGTAIRIHCFISRQPKARLLGLGFSRVGFRVKDVRV